MRSSSRRPLVRRGLTLAIALGTVSLAAACQEAAPHIAPQPPGMHSVPLASGQPEPGSGAPMASGPAFPAGSPESPLPSADTARPTPR